MILLAVVDADLKFTLVDIGSYGGNSDAAIFANSNLGRSYMDGELDVPQAEELPDYPQGGKIPFALVADEAFPLREDVHRPYSRRTILPHEEKKKIYNLRYECFHHCPQMSIKPIKYFLTCVINEITISNRMGRPRVKSENTFGVMVHRFRMFLGRINLSPRNVIKVIQACVVLHNYLRTPTEGYHQLMRRLNPDGQDIPEDAGLAPFTLGGNHPSDRSVACRDTLADYFVSDVGKLSWQRRAAALDN